jgi:hypothetical protein
MCTLLKIGITGMLKRQYVSQQQQLKLQTIVAHKALCQTNCIIARKNAIVQSRSARVPINKCNFETRNK